MIFMGFGVRQRAQRQEPPRGLPNASAGSMEAAAAAARGPRCGLAAALLTLFFALLFPAQRALAQESIRMSIASEEAAEARRQATELGYCNIQYGDFKARLQTYAGAIYNNNITYSESQPQPDTVLRAGIDLQSILPITEFNSLYLSTGAGYSKFLRMGSNDSATVSPDSGIIFKMFVGNSVVELHDRFSLVQSSADLADSASVNGYDRFRNTFGPAVRWDLNKIIVSFGADYDLLRATQTNYDYASRDSGLGSVRAMYEVTPNFSVGPEAAGGATYYVKKDYLDNHYYSMGVAASAKFSQFLKARVSGGYVAYDFDTSDPRNLYYRGFDSYYASLTVEHRLNSKLTHAVTLRHSLSLGDWVNLRDIDEVNYALRWAVGQRLSLSPGASYASGNDYTDQKETERWLGLSLTTSYALGPKLGLDVTGRYSKRAGYDAYSQSGVSLNLRYTF